MDFWIICLEIDNLFPNLEIEELIPFFITKGLAEVEIWSTLWFSEHFFREIAHKIFSKNNFLSDYQNIFSCQNIIK